MDFNCRHANRANNPAQFGTVWNSLAQITDCADRKVLLLRGLVSGWQNRSAEGGTRTHTEFPPLPPQDSVYRPACNSFYNIRHESKAFSFNPAIKITNNNQGEAK